MSARAYWIVVVLLFLGLIGCKELYLRMAELTCWSGGYRQNAWLAYCNSQRYGIYDIEAIWHRIEADVAPDITRAQVLTLSDSHLQNALSLGGASEWLAAHRYSAYLLGLPMAESGFADQLLRNFHPHPAVVIFDASPFFTGTPGVYERGIFADPQSSRQQVLQLKDFQSMHRRICDSLPWTCGHNFSYFRSRTDGHWIFPADARGIWIGRRSVPNDDEHYPTWTAANELRPLYPRYLQVARALVEKLGIPRRCVVMTNVPAETDLRDLSRYLADSLGTTVIEPDVPGLSTFDHAHLTPDSARRWTQAFLAQLEPVLRSCVQESQSRLATVVPLE
jgi:hypothetical protein